MTHLLYTPFTGLGLYGGHRGKRWLRNRIQIYKQFVVKSLQNQQNQDFIIWISWRYEDKNDEYIRELRGYLEDLFPGRVVFTYSGVCFWDDKHPDDVARTRLIEAIHGAIPAISNIVGESKELLVTIQPSDDCYHGMMTEEVQQLFAQNENLQACAYRKGYVMDYTTGRVAEWNPKTSPPFYTIKFHRETFMDPLKHVEYAGIKSHEYLPEKLETATAFDTRGYLVGTHGENISTIFNHPFRGNDVPKYILDSFGLEDVPVLKLPISLRKRFMRRLPHGWQRKLRYWLGERGYARFYSWIRS